MSAIKMLRMYLSKLYRSTLGLEMVEDLLERSNNPVWLDRGASAWMLDRDIGLALRIEVFHSKSAGLNEAIQDVLGRVALLQPRTDISDAEIDPLGMWQLAIIWIIEDPKLEDSWRAAISEVRKESGFSEEIGLDALIVSSDFESACRSHGFPQLLLNVRRVLQMSSDEIPTWSSANAKVKEALKGFPDRFAGDAETRRLAVDLVKDVLADESWDLPEATDSSSLEKRFESIRNLKVQNFRNIRHMALEFPAEDQGSTQALVVYGPNGVGKTSLFEAMCIGAGGVSRSWEQYESDLDIESRRRDYAGGVIAPLDSDQTPCIHINGLEVAIAPRSAAQAAWRSLDGNFLGQEDSRDFLGESSSALAERVLRGYSTLADHATQLAAGREAAARGEKSAWLREHGLSAAISRRETRAQKLVEGEIKKLTLGASSDLLEWLETTPFVQGDSQVVGKGIAKRWRDWLAQQARIVAAVAKAIERGEVSRVHSSFKDWLDVRNSIVTETTILVSQVGLEMGKIRAQFSGVERDLDTWAEWLATRQGPDGGLGKSEQGRLSEELTSYRNELRTTRGVSELVRRRERHLQQLQADLLPAWLPVEPNTCPTCGQDHSSGGGIGVVINHVQAHVEELLKKYDARESQLAVQVSQIETRLASMGMSPIPDERQREIQRLLAPLIGSDTLVSRLSDLGARMELKRRVRALLSLPEVPAVQTQEGVEETTRRLVERALTLDREAERLWPLPERWKAISTALKEECDSIVATHLPETLQRLWWEVAGALTAARWNLMFRAEFILKQAGKVVVGTRSRPDTPARLELTRFRGRVVI